MRLSTNLEDWQRRREAARAHNLCASDSEAVRFTPRMSVDVG
jgi:hypothetical protein